MIGVRAVIFLGRFGAPPIFDMRPERTPFRRIAPVGNAVNVEIVGAFGNAEPRMGVDRVDRVPFLYASAPFRGRGSTWLGGRNRGVRERLVLGRVDRRLLMPPIEKGTAGVLLRNPRLIVPFVDDIVGIRIVDQLSDIHRARIRDDAVAQA